MTFDKFVQKVGRLKLNIELTEYQARWIAQKLLDNFDLKLIDQKLIDELYKTIS